MADKQSDSLLERYATQGSYENPNTPKATRPKDEIIADLKNTHARLSDSPFTTPNLEEAAYQNIAQQHENAKNAPRYDTRVVGHETPDFDTLKKIQELAGTQDRRNPNDRTLWGHVKSLVGIKSRK